MQRAEKQVWVTSVTTIGDCNKVNKQRNVCGWRSVDRPNQDQGDRNYVRGSMSQGSRGISGSQVTTGFGKMKTKSDR